MKKDLELDSIILQAFKTEAEKIETDDRLKMSIDRVIRNSENGEEKKMKRFTLKKKIAFGIICCGLVSTGIFAAGQVTSLVGHTDLRTVCKDYSKLDKQEKKLGYDVNVIKDFSNGYTFEEMNIQEVEGQDDEGKKVETFKELDVTYQNAEGKEISFSANQKFAGTEFRKANETQQCGDITLYYNLDTYKIVPEDYELTEEDKKNEERDDYYISCGSDEVEIQKMSSVSWEQDGVRYLLLGIDTDMDADQMFAMASEIVK